MGTESVGKIGELHLEYARRGGTTVLTHSYSCSPWHCFPPLYLDDTGCATTFLVNPSGGLVGGDRLSLFAKLGKGTHVLFSTPSATKVYRSVSESSVQFVDLTMDSGAILEWIPEPTIPFAGSRFDQRITVRLGPGALVVFWDALASGRVARGEQWAFTRLANQIKITTAGGKSVIERYILSPTRDGRGVGLGAEWNYVASLYLVSDGVDSETWKRIEGGLAEVLNSFPNRVLGGVSETRAPGLVVKLVTRSAPELHAVLEGMWGIVRSHLWGASVPALRRS